MADNPGAVVSSSPPLSAADDSSTNVEDQIKLGLHEQSLGLRKMYAKWVLGIVIAQILAINIYFVFDSVGVIPGTYYPFNPPSDVFKVFAISVFASVIALAFVVLYSLFPGEGKGFWATIAEAIFKRGG